MRVHYRTRAIHFADTVITDSHNDHPFTDASPGASVLLDTVCSHASAGRQRTDVGADDRVDLVYGDKFGDYGGIFVPSTGRSRAIYVVE